MIRQHHHRIGLPALLQISQHRFQDTRVNPLNRRDLSLDIRMVAALIRSFQMNIHKVTPTLEGVDGRRGFPFKIRIQRARRTVHVDALKARTEANALNQVNSRNHRAGKAIELTEKLQRRTFSLAPEPTGGGLMQAALTAADIHRVIAQNFTRTLHHIKHPLAIAAVRQMVRNGTACNVMRRGTVRTGIRMGEHQTVPVTDAGIQVNILRVQLCGNRRNQSSGFFGRDFTGRVIHHHGILKTLRVRKRDQIAAHCHIIVRQADTHAHSFQRRTSCITFCRVIAHYRKIGCIRTGFHAVGHSFHQSAFAVLCQVVHSRRLRRFQGSAISQRCHRIVRCTVRQNNYIFHTVNAFLVEIINLF